MADQRFRDGDVHTGFVPELLARSPIGTDDFESETVVPVKTVQGSTTGPV